MYRTGNNSRIAFIVLDLVDGILFFSLVPLAEHRMRLSRAGLPIGKDGDIIPIGNFGHHIDQLSIDVPLRGLTIECVVEFHLKLRVLVCRHPNALALCGKMGTSERTYTTSCVPF